MKLSLSDRIKFSITAIKKHGLMIPMGLVFLGIGCFLIILGIKYDNNIPLLVTGSFVTLFMGFFLGYTMPSSLLYYYEKAVIKKYGSYTNAIITKKYIEDQSYEERVDNRVDKIELFIYTIDYKFNYHKDFTNSFIVEDKACFDKLEIGSTIPIKFLKHKPQQSEPRRQKLCNDLDLKRNQCN